MGKSKLEKISHGSCSPPTPLFEQPRQTYVVSGHEQLNVALEPDDRELTEGYEQLIAIVAEHEIVTAEARAD